MKRCGKCQEIKPMDCFGQNKNNKDGKSGRCRPCTNAGVKTWLKSPKGKASQAKRKAHLKARKGTITLSREALVQLQGNRCYYCQQPFTAERKATLDHFIPLNRGGWDADGNRVAACATCNYSKDDKLVEEWWPTYSQWLIQTGVMFAAPMPR